MEGKELDRFSIILRSQEPDHMFNWIQSFPHLRLRIEMCVGKTFLALHEIGV